MPFLLIISAACKIAARGKGGERERRGGKDEKEEKGWQNAPNQILQILISKACKIAAIRQKEGKREGRGGKNENEEKGWQNAPPPPKSNS